MSNDEIASQAWNRGYSSGLKHALQMFESVDDTAMRVPTLDGSGQIVRGLYARAIDAVKRMMASTS